MFVFFKGKYLVSAFFYNLIIIAKYESCLLQRQVYFSQNYASAVKTKKKHLPLW